MAVSRLRGSCHDDRGVRFRLRGRIRLPRGIPARVWIPIASADALSPVTLLLCIGAGLVATVAAIAYTFRGPLAPNRDEWLGVIRIFIAHYYPWMILLGALVALRRPLVRFAAGACLRLRQCPSCGYRLADLPVQADGCTVCPECGAAWRVPS